MGFWEKFFEVILSIVGTALFVVFIILIFLMPGLIALSFGWGWLGLYVLHLVAYAALEAWPYRK